MGSIGALDRAHTARYGLQLRPRSPERIEHEPARLPYLLVAEMVCVAAENDRGAILARGIGHRLALDRLLVGKLRSDRLDRSSTQPLRNGVREPVRQARREPEDRSRAQDAAQALVAAILRAERVAVQAQHPRTI